MLEGKYFTVVISLHLHRNSFQCMFAITLLGCNRSGSFVILHMASKVTYHNGRPGDYLEITAMKVFERFRIHTNNGNLIQQCIWFRLLQWKTTVNILIKKILCPSVLWTEQQQGSGWILMYNVCDVKYLESCVVQLLLAFHDLNSIYLKIWYSPSLNGNISTCLGALLSLILVVPMSRHFRL